jgi:hypothetical protein
MKGFLRGLAAFAAVGLLALGTASRANAAATLMLSVSGGPSITIVDGGAGDTCAAINCVTFNGPLGDWDINVSTGTSKTAATPNLLDLNSVDHHTAGINDTLTIRFSDTGFIGTQAGFTLGVGGTQSAGGTVTFSAFDGVGLFDLAKQIGSTLTSNATVYSFTTSGGGPSANPYSLTEIATITFGANAGQASFDAQITAVPEPAGVALLGGLLLFTVGAIRRKVSRVR